MMQVRAEQFKFFAEALKSAKLKLYVPYFVQEAQVRSYKHSSINTKHDRYGLKDFHPSG